MLPLIRKTDSRGNGARRKFLRIFLAALLLLALFFLLRACIAKSSRLDDFSGGRYAETFKTNHPALKKELLTLHAIISRQNSRTMDALEPFLLLHASPEMEQFLKNESFFTALSLAADSEDPFLISYMSYVSRLRGMLNHVRTPLKGVAPHAGKFVDFQDILRKGFRVFYASPERNADSLKVLETMFAYSYAMLDSDFPDVSFLGSSVESAETFLNSNPLSVAERRQLTELLREALRRPFPQQNLIRFELLRSMRDYEKVRLNGFHLFLGKPKPEIALKESVSGNGKTTFFTALKIMGQDFFYDVDRDQIQTIRMYKFFMVNEFIPFRSFNAYFSAEPMHPVSLREFDSLKNSLRRQSEILDALRGLLLRLDPSFSSPENRRSYVNGRKEIGVDGDF